MEKPKKGIVVDGSTRGNPGPSEYRGIDLETGNVLFHQKIGISSNNICEYIALCHGILYALKNNIEDVYTDSQTALSWLKHKNVNSSLPKNAMTSKSYEYLDRIKKAIESFKLDDQVILININNKVNANKWYTSEYGEIPADFGIKK